MAPLDFTEDDVTRVSLNISGTAGALGPEAIELRNWIIRFGWALEELRVIFTKLSDWMAQYPPPWDAYCALTSCHIVALNKGWGSPPWELGRCSAGP